MLQANRFKSEDIGPLLQHYGIRTYWLDLVDNIFTASWFASFNNKGEFGYIKFFVDKINGNNTLTICDLRKEHSSLSLRLHCQHGLSVRKTDTSLTPGSIDFSDFMVAMVRVPTEIRKTINIKKAYMFPGEEIDNTLKYLKKSRFSKNISKALDKFGYPSNFLGEIE